MRFFRVNVYSSFSLQEENDNACKGAKSRWNDAKICDYPECRIRRKEVTIMAKQMRTCSLCGVATYCCDEHGDLHWLTHVSLCREVRWETERR